MGAGYDLSPIVFEMDDDTNFHMDMIAGVTICMPATTARTITISISSTDSKNPPCACCRRH